MLCTLKGIGFGAWKNETQLCQCVILVSLLIIEGASRRELRGVQSMTPYTRGWTLLFRNHWPEL